MNKHFAYLRVSTADQHLDRQYEAMKKFDIPEENYFVEKISGKNMERPELQKLLSIIREGDTLHIHDFSRLSRSTSDLLKMTEKLNSMGVTLVSNKENLDTSTATGKLMLTMIAAINEFERNNTREKADEGIRIAKANGVYKKKEIDLDKLRALKSAVDKGLLSVTTAASELNISRVTWYKLVKNL